MVAVCTKKNIKKTDYEAQYSKGKSYPGGYMSREEWKVFVEMNSLPVCHPIAFYRYI